MITYLLIVYGLGATWIWLLLFARGAVQLVGGVVVVCATLTVVTAQRRRSRRLRSQWEWIPSRAITHAGLGASSRWNRDRRETPDDPDDFESHLGGGF